MKTGLGSVGENRQYTHCPQRKLTCTLVGVAFLMREVELVEVSLSDSSPELGSSETYVLRILFALSWSALGRVRRIRVNVAGLKEKSLLMAFWLSRLISALFGSPLNLTTLPTAWRISKYKGQSDFFLCLSLCPTYLENP